MTLWQGLCHLPTSLHPAIGKFFGKLLYIIAGSRKKIDALLKKKFVFIGFSAWLLLIPLAITSSDKMVRLLKQNWKKLHKLIYVISIFGVLHFIWLSKTIFFKNLCPLN